MCTYTQYVSPKLLLSTCRDQQPILCVHRENSGNDLHAHAQRQRDRLVKRERSKQRSDSLSVRVDSHSLVLLHTFRLQLLPTSSTLGLA